MTNHTDTSRSGGQKPAEPDWIEHHLSPVCPVPAGHDVEVEYNWGKTYRCDNPELRDWTRITHYRDWTAFEQQQASAGESVPYWAWKRAVELTGPNRSSSQVLQDFARYIAAHEPKGEVPKLLTPEQAARISELREPELILGALTLAGLIAPEPEPVDPLVEALEDLDDAKAREAKLRACLGFFASVIKSGEPWTATCEQRYRAALQEKQT